MEGRIDKLKRYLEGGEAMDESPEGDGIIVGVGVFGTPADPFFNLLADLCAIDMLAKDLHYRVRGAEFYGLHELADEIFKIGDAFDDLNEVYYLGELQSVPPIRASVSTAAVETIKVAYAAANAELQEREDVAIMRGLHAVCLKAVSDVELCKTTTPSAGTSSVIDDISKRCLQASGLLQRTLTA